jgi:hypothetical protein
MEMRSKDPERRRAGHRQEDAEKPKQLPSHYDRQNDCKGR